VGERVTTGAAKTRKQRVDLLLVERGLAPSRERAQALLMAGQVRCGDRPIDKAGTRLDADADLRVVGVDHPYVSRGGLKLAAALDAFDVDPQGLVALDVGASTGGFTDCLLQRGARKVFAVDVGYGQLAHTLRRDPRVVVLERVNARELSATHVPESVDLLTIDVSFISLRLVVPACLPLLRKGGKLVALVKPQFEVGKGEVGKGGVVRDTAKRAEAIGGIVAFCRDQGLEVLGTIDSPITGPAGNLEALLVATKPND
jgi:23S rRNA (cytidine1920-2'-O)/16S rRNA (cytidine1409-2'-O)-methyltransferase